MLRRLAAVLVVSAACVLGIAAPVAAAPLQPPVPITGVPTAAVQAGVTAGVVTGVSTGVSTGVEDFEFLSFDADYYLSRDADGTSRLRTVETLVARFPDFDQNRGILRSIPLDYDGVPLSPDVESVTDPDGAAVPFEESSDGTFLELALGTDDYVYGETAYTITYTQQNVIRSFSDTDADEFYWDTNGTGFPQPFGSVTARVHLDDELAAALTGSASCYRGAQGSTDLCQIEQRADAPSGAVFEASATDLGPGENVSVAIGFDPGTFLTPEPPQPAPWTVFAGIALVVLGLLTAVIAIVVRLTGPRDSRGRGTIIAEYSVPDDLNLLEAGDLVGRTSTSMAATFVSLAVRGKVRIIDEGTKFALAYVDGTGVDAQESAVLDALFGPARKRRTRNLSTTDNPLGTELKAVTGATRAAVVARGWRVKAAGSRPWVVVFVAAGLLAASVIVFIIGALVSPAISGWLFGAGALGMLALVVALICAARPAIITDEGAVRRDYLKGLRVYLDLAEAQRFQLLQSPEGADRIDVGDRAQVVKLYEKLLPFAVLWGVEEEWSQELAVSFAGETPGWYQGNIFTPIAFGAAMGRFSGAATSASVPVAASTGSTSGGSMGGGFSGGGGGGGGGGGR